MSTVTAEQTRLRHARPSFFGLVGGEFFKIMRQWTTWILLVLLGGAILFPYIIEYANPTFATQLHDEPLHLFYNILSIGLGIVRIFSGIFLLIMTARIIGLEYQLGTIRILLSRGVGRLQLLFAKLTTVVIIALVVLALGILLNYLLVIILVDIISGNLNAFQALTPQFWSDAQVYVLTMLINAGVTILLATAAAVVGRSLSFGLSAALVFFPIDNIVTSIIVDIAYRVTHNDFWLNLTAYLLGPNLNAMPSKLVDRLDSIGITPLYIVDPVTHQTHGTLVDGTHTLVVTAVYAAVFAVTVIWLTWKRDIKE